MKKNVERSYEIPPGLRVYAIGDIHGHLAALDAMHEAISMDLLARPPESAHIVYLGDYIDRGPDGRGVIERLIERRDRGDGIPKTFLKGNHEAAVFEFMDDPLGSDWLKYGGMDTLASYGIRFESAIALPAEAERAAEFMREAIPRAHFEFLQALSLSLVIGDYFFAHAGVDPAKPLDRQSERDLTCIRQPFLSWHESPVFRPLSHRVVHGHSVSEAPVIRPHRIGVDTGHFAGGPLSAAVLEGREVRFLQVGHALQA
jgi:serine/threonine protein phosphatase 1